MLRVIGETRWIGIIQRVLLMALAVQCAYIMWQLVSFAQVPGKLIVTPPSPPVASSHYNWIKQNVTVRKQAVAAPKRRYLFVTMKVSVSGIIHSGNTPSIAIVDSSVGKNAIVAVGDRLKNTDIVVEEIAVNHVVFREADKTFSVSWRQSLLPSIQTTSAEQLQPASQTPDSSVRKARSARNNLAPNQANAPVIKVRPQGAAELKLVQQVIRQPKRLLDYLLFAPILENGVVTGGRVTVLKQQALFARMGIQTNDIVRAVNNTPVAQVGFDMLESNLAKRQVTLTIERNNEIRTVEITL